MSTYRLDRLLSPRSLAVVGASPHESSVGRHIIANIRSAGFAGPIHVVNPHHPEIEGLATLKSMESIAEAPDVAIIAVPPAAVPEAVAEAGRRGVAAAVIITAGLGRGPGSAADVTEAAARTTGLRLVGPNCLGVLVPSAHLNASFATRMPQKGDLAVISQSGAIVAGMIEWAAQRSIGFSAVVSVGDQLDVDLGDLLDQFATDPATRAIVLYIESVKDARKFMSAARAAARAKSVIVIKAGRHAQGAKAAATHTGALAGSDAVYDAAFRRAGLLRVFDLDELFDATETLGRLKPFPGQRLAILTNGGGVGVLAVDRLIDLGGVLAELSTETRSRRDSVLPPTWSKSNPVDIVGDADAARYAAALDALLADAQNDAILVLNVPTALASPTTTAQVVAEHVRKYRATILRPKPVLAVWLGADTDAGSQFELVVGGCREPVRLPLLGRHNIYNALAAAALGLERGLTPSQVAGALAELAPADKRGEVLRVAGATVIGLAWCLRRTPCCRRHSPLGIKPACALSTRANHQDPGPAELSSRP